MSSHPRDVILKRRAQFIAATLAMTSLVAPVVHAADGDGGARSDASDDASAAADGSDDAGTAGPQACLCAATPKGSSADDGNGVAAIGVVGALTLGARRRRRAREHEKK